MKDITSTSHFTQRNVLLNLSNNFNFHLIIITATLQVLEYMHRWDLISNLWTVLQHFPVTLDVISKLRDKQLHIMWLFPTTGQCTDKGLGNSWSVDNLSAECSHEKRNTSLPYQLFIQGQKFLDVATGKPYERTLRLARTTAFIFFFPFDH